VDGTPRGSVASRCRLLESHHQVGRLRVAELLHPCEGSPGDLVFKPRNQWHTFWNAGDTLCRILEIISPAGFEHFFNQLGEQMAEARRSAWRWWPDVAGRAARYGHYFQPESIDRLCREHRLVYPAWTTLATENGDRRIKMSQGTPEEVLNSVVEGINAGNLDALMPLYGSGRQSARALGATSAGTA
jgi:hypothetical protein